MSMAVPGNEKSCVYSKQLGIQKDANDSGSHLDSTSSPDI